MICSLELFQDFSLSCVFTALPDSCTTSSIYIFPPVDGRVTFFTWVSVMQMIGAWLFLSDSSTCRLTISEPKSMVSIHSDVLTSRRYRVLPFTRSINRPVYRLYEKKLGAKSLIARAVLSVKWSACTCRLSPSCRVTRLVSCFCSVRVTPCE